VDVARACGIAAWDAGRVEAGPKELHIEALGLRFSGESLQLR
jgi:phosphoribosylformylglycinamidine cyclo-ligase